MLNYSKIIDESGLFFFDEKIKEMTSPEQFEQLLNLELWDWISSLYWGEGLGIEYALKMSELSKTKEEKDRWIEIYKQELDHQQRISQWLLNNNSYPLQPNMMIKKIQRLTEKNKNAKTFESYKEVIERGQIFLEETGSTLIKWRLNFIKDRSLKAILYKILKEEASHISDGKKKLNELNPYSKSRSDLLIENFKILFPYHLAKTILQPEEYKTIRSISQDFLKEKLSEITTSKSPRPSPMIAKFEHVDGYECFGCKPTRSEGLLLEPKILGEKVIDELIFGNYFAGMNGLVHGGFISMALDEMMGYAITLGREKLSLTRNLSVDFLKPVRCNEPYIIETWITDDTSLSDVKIEGHIRDKKNGEICAKSTATFFILTNSVCSRLFPGIHKDSKLSHMYI